jgi:hypothetical protein
MMVMFGLYLFTGQKSMHLVHLWPLISAMELCTLFILTLFVLIVPLILIIDQNMGCYQLNCNPQHTDFVTNVSIHCQTTAKKTLMKHGNNSGDSALSPDQMSLAISNVPTAGFEIHDLLGDQPSKRFSYERSVPSTKLCLPVLFIHKGHAILGGSSAGKPGLWAADLEYPIHLLDHDGEIKCFSHFPGL